MAVTLNLLPYRHKRQQEVVRLHAWALGLVASSIVLAWLAVFALFSFKVERVATENAALKSDIEQLKKKIGELDKLKKLKSEAQGKLGVLDTLRAAKKGPLARFGTLARALGDKSWLTKYAEAGEAVSLSGIAASEEQLAEFMRQLEASPEFTRVELVVAEQQTLAGTKVKRFDLTARLEGLEPAKPEVAKTAKPAPAKAAAVKSAAEEGAR